MLDDLFVQAAIHIRECQGRDGPPPEGSVFLHVFHQTIDVSIFVSASLIF